MHELRIGMGGQATALLHDDLTTAQTLIVSGERVPGHTDREAAKKVVIDYLSFYRAYRSASDWPENPYDPNNWGHDTRIKDLGITNTVTNAPLAVSPDFDPEVTAYTTTDSLGGLRYNTMFFDPLLTAAKHLNTKLNDSLNPTSVRLRVTSYDGQDQRDYTITKVDPE